MLEIEFPKRVAENIARFTGRAWLLPTILDWWDRGDKRLFLLSGGPGSGKSMIMAWLGGVGPEPEDQTAKLQLARVREVVKAVHFCQADSRNITPQAFAESVANQLTRTVSGFGDAFVATLAERVQVKGSANAEVVESGATVTGTTIGQIDLGTLGDELSFDRAFTQPLKKLYETGHGEPMLVLVDALDEAQTYTGVTLVDLLSRLSDLPAPVRILATTRDEPRVLKYFRSVQPFDLIRNADPDVDDVRNYAELRLAGLTSIEQSKRIDFTGRLVDKANGVFLYAALVLDELMASSTSVLPDLDSYPLPNKVSGLYHAFLTRELGKNEQRWFDQYQPLLGLISVAQSEGLTDQQLTAIIGSEITAALRACKQYLTGALPDGPFRVFHKSFADFLFTDKENVDYHIDATTMHRRIADHYWSYKADWSRCDDYGLENLAAHLAASHLSAPPSDTVYPARLYEFMTSRVALAKWERFGSLGSFSKDLAIARAVAAQETPLNWADFMRCYLIEQTLSSRDLSAGGVRFIAACVQKCGAPADTRKIIDRMLELASAIRTPSEKAGALSATAAFLFQAGYVEEARSVVQRAFDETASIQNIQEKSTTLSTIVLDMATIQDRERAKDIAREALAIAQSTDFAWAKAISVSEVAYALSKIGDEELAKEAFSIAQSAAWNVPANDERAYALCAVAAAMDRAGDEKAQYVFRDATSQLYGSGMPPEEIEDEYRAIYLDYQSRSGRDLGSLFSMALEIQGRNQRHAALCSLAVRMAREVLNGDYPHWSRGERNVDQLCDREMFLRIAAEDERISASGEATLTLRALCEAIVESAASSGRALD